jgi:pilus assembly protein CpaD
MVSRFPLLPLAAAVLLAGCGGTQNRGVESIHQPVVSRTDYVFDVQTAGGGLAPGEPARLAGWMESLRVGYGDRISVDEGQGYGAIGDVAAAAARHGLIVERGVPVTTGPVPMGMARVVVSRTRASVPSCPDHSREYQPDYNAHTSSNYGCAVNSNLAAMIAHPEDLVQGQAGSGITDTATAGRAIGAYRQGGSGAGGGAGAGPGGGVAMSGGGGSVGGAAASPPGGSPQ